MQAIKGLSVPDVHKCVRKAACATGRTTCVQIWVEFPTLVWGRHQNPCPPEEADDSDSFKAILQCLTFCEPLADLGCVTKYTRHEILSED